MKHTVFALGSFLLLAIAAGKASATAFHFNDFASWSSAVTGVVTNEDFSTDIANAQVLAINGDLTATANGVPSGGTNSHRVTGGEYDVWFGTTRDYSGFTWAFANPINGFYVDLIGFSADFSVSFTGGSNTITDTLGTGGFGVIFDSPLSSVTFSTTDTFDNAQMDNLNYATAAPAPVPATLLLIVPAFGGLGFMNWRKRRVARAV